MADELRAVGKVLRSLATGTSRARQRGVQRRGAVAFAKDEAVALRGQGGRINRHHAKVQRSQISVTELPPMCELFTRATICKISRRI